MNETGSNRQTLQWIDKMMINYIANLHDQHFTYMDT